MTVRKHHKDGILFYFLENRVVFLILAGSMHWEGLNTHTGFLPYSYVLMSTTRVSSARDGAKTSIEFLIVFQKVLVHTK